MSKVKTSTVITEATFSENEQHRYLLKKEWNAKNKKAMVIMIQPNKADTVLLDHTTVFVINNLHKLGYGSVEIVNLFSKIDSKVKLKDGMNKLIGEETDKYIKEAGGRVGAIIVACGSIADNSKKVKQRQEDVLELLSDYKDKMKIICDPKGKRGLHPLCPSVRNSWILEDFVWKGKTTAKQEQKQNKNPSPNKPKGKDKTQQKAAKEAKQDD